MPNETSTPVKGAVITKYLSGESKTQITEDLGMTYATVRKILNEAEVDRHVAEAQSVFIEESYETAKSIMKAAKKNATIGLEIMDRTGILPKRAESSGNSNVINIGANFEGLPGLK